MLTAKDIRRQLHASKPSLGTWLQIPSAESAEIIGRMGYDWAAIDMEHGSFTRAHLPDIFRALERWGTLPFVRVLEPTMAAIRSALDTGAAGIILPMIETRAQLDNAMSHALYPAGYQGGKRGVGFCRGNMFGLDFDLHVNKDSGTEHDVVLVAQIEHVNALNDIDAIFSHPRLDAYMIGPYDLSASMGLTGQFTHPEFLHVLNTIEQKATQHNVPKGFHVVAPDEAVLQNKIDEGYTFIAYGIDALFLQNAARCPKVK